MTQPQIQQFAQKAFVVNDGKLLCVRKSKDDPSWPLYWETPGGRMEFGEDVEDHFCREVKEETSVDTIPERPFYVWQWQMTRKGIERQVIAVARLARLEDPNSVISLDNNTKSDCLDMVEWIPLEELKNQLWIPNFKQVIEAFLALPENQ